MESSSPKKNHRERESHTNMGVKKNGVFSKMSKISNYDSRTEHSFTKNKIIVDDDDDEDNEDDDDKEGTDINGIEVASRRVSKLFDNSSNSNASSDTEYNFASTRTCDELKGSKLRNSSVIASCKPCYVMLERLSEECMRSLPSEKYLKKGNSRDSRKRNRKTKWGIRNRRRRRDRGKFISTNLRTEHFDRKNLEAIHFTQKRLKKIQSINLITEILESDAESHAGDRHENLDSPPLPYDEKFDFNNCGSKISSPKRFNLSLGKRNPEKKEDQVRRRIVRGGLSATGNLEDGNGVDETVSSTDSNNYLSPSNASNAVGTCESTTRSGVTLRSRSSRFMRETSGRCGLSLPEKNNDASNGAVGRRNPCSKISGDSNQISDSSPSQIVNARRAPKRKAVREDDDEAVVPKLTKSEDNCGKCVKLDPNSPQTSGSSGSTVCGNVSRKQKLSPEVEKNKPAVEDASVSVVGLKFMENPSTSKQVENGCSSDSCDETCGIHGLEVQPKVVGSNSPNKNRNSKITDYFFKIDKKQVLSQGSGKYYNRITDDPMLKKKYGIFRHVVISVIDLKRLEIFGPQYSASEIDKLTQKYPKPSIDFHSTAATDNFPPTLSSAPPKRNLESTSKESSTNVDLRSRSSVTNHSKIDDHSNKRSHVFPNIKTVPMTLTLSPLSHKSSSSKKYCELLNKCVVERRKTLGTESERVLANSMDHAEYHFIHEGKVSREKSSPRLNTTSPSASTIVSELGHDPSEPRQEIGIGRPSKTAGSGDASAESAPAKQIDCITDRTESKEPEETVKMTSGSHKTVAVQEKNDVTTVDISNDLPGGNEQHAGMRDHLSVDKDCNAVMDQPVAEKAALTSVTKFAIKTEASPPPAVNRILPLNSMTFISREILEENNSWLGLDDARDNVAASVQQDGPSNIRAEDKSRKDKTILSGNTPNNVDSLVNITVVNQQNKGVSATAELTNANSKPINLPSSESVKHTIGGDLPITSSPTKTRSNMTDKNVGGIRGSESSTRMDTSDLGVPTPGRISPIRTPVDLNSVTIGADGNCEDPNSGDESPAESQEENRLHIDTDDDDSNLQTAGGPLKNATSSNCSTGSTPLQKGEADNNKNTTKELLPAECVICKKRYKTARKLASHLKVHVNCADTSCVLCDKQLTKTGAIKHYLGHCSYLEIGETEYYTCAICDLKFKKKESLTDHLKVNHSVGKYRSKMKVGSKKVRHNRCDVCQLSCNSEEELFSHLYTHTQKELQDAFQNARAKQETKRTATAGGDQTQRGDVSENKKAENKEQATPEVTTVSIHLPTPQNRPMLVCYCHRDERLEISGGVIIEVALACLQCKTFFKYRKCLEGHFAAGLCKSDSVVRPRMFCNKCCAIVNTWPELLAHLKKHNDDDVKTKTSFLCKRCNICFFGFGPRFYEHWLSHCQDSSFVAHHSSFPKNMKVKIVESEGPESTEDDEPTESLFIAEHQCVKCEKPFQTNLELEDHLESSDSCSDKVHSAPQVLKDPKTSYKLVCSLCNKEFTDKSKFDAHIEDFLVEHGPVKDFLPLPKYSDTSLGNNRFLCTICETESTTVKDYEKHMTSHEVIQENFYCNHCTLMLDSIEDFKRHSAEHKGSPEHPVVCKVVFATATFHCKPCRIRFDDLSALDKHLTTHNKSVVSDPKLVGDETHNSVTAIEEEIPDTTRNRQELDGADLDSHGKSHETSASDPATSDRAVIQLSDDSNSNDIKLVPTEEKGDSKKGNEPHPEEQEKTNNEKVEKPAFLRVKNLEELLPYSCSKCKAEFDTQINLNKHVCAQHSDSPPIYTCRICNGYKCNNESDYRLHVSSHFPPRSIPMLCSSWYQMDQIASGPQIFKCNFCPTFGCLSINILQLHFRVIHPDIYRPKFKCRFCGTFESVVEREIDDHEAAHVLSQSRQPATISDNNLPPLEKLNGPPPLIHLEPTSSSIADASSVQSADTSINSLQPPFTSSDGLPKIQPFVNSKSVQLPVVNVSSNNVRNNPPAPEKLKNVVNPRQSVPTFHLLRNPNNFQQPIYNSLATNSSNNLPTVQSARNLDPSQQVVRTLPPNNNANNFQASVAVPPISCSASDTTPTQSVNSSNFHQPVQIRPTTTSTNNLSFFQPMPIFNNPQQLCAIVQPQNNSNNFQPSIQIQPATSSASNLSTLNFGNSQQLDSTIRRNSNNSNSFQPAISIPHAPSTAANLSGLQPATQTLQIQINTNNLPFNNMTGVMQTVPLYVANLIYSCNICKNFECSTEQELKAHKDLHESVRNEKSPKRLFMCKICTNTLCPSEEHLKDHMASCHNVDKTKLLSNKRQNNLSNVQMKCKHCLQTFTSAGQLTQHVNDCHTSFDQTQIDTQFKHVYPYTCRICSIGFLNERVFYAHNRQIHANFKSTVTKKSTNSRTIYQCDICGLLLISEETLSYHQKSHLGFQ